jgi:hypothetical protein
MRYILIGFLSFICFSVLAIQPQECLRIGEFCSRDADCCNPTCTSGESTKFGYLKGTPIQDSIGNTLTTWDPNRYFSVATKCAWPTFRCTAKFLDGNACNGNLFQ